MKKEEHIDLIKRECLEHGIVRPEQIAYVLATVEHETAGTFRPVREAFWLPDRWRRQNLQYYPYYGRGYVQITWRENYAKYQKETGEPLLCEPDIAMEPAVAAFILCHGFKHGVFTGKRIDDYINADKTDFVQARRCINGSDKAHRIARLAKNWMVKLAKEV